MFIITLLVPYAMMIGWEYFPETDDSQFNEINFYLFFIAIAYRWRDDGEDIPHLKL